jgi:transcriptional regulator with XRE-family HTH domain
MAPVQKWSGREARALRDALRMSLREFSAYLGVGERTVSKWESEGASRVPRSVMQQALDTALERCSDEVKARFEQAVESAGTVTDAELDAIELARRVEASDVSDSTLGRLEHAVDELAMAYAPTPPPELIPRVRRHIEYVARLMDARKTLEQQRRALVIGGWLSLLAATLHIDLRQRDTAMSWLQTAEQMATHAGHAEIAAWCYETRAWDVLTAGRYDEALALAQQAQALAPAGSSAQIQATAQEGRAWARMGRSPQTRKALDRVARLASNLDPPDRPEHHFKYDPDKAVAYTATTLAWVGDPAAEDLARHVIRHLEAAMNGIPRPRRVASARLDLGLALLAADKPEEAGAEAITAVTSGRVVPSNWWRAVEVLDGVDRDGVPVAAELRDACEAHRPQPQG